MKKNMSSALFLSLTMAKVKKPNSSFTFLRSGGKCTYIHTHVHKFCNCCIQAQRCANG